MASSSSSSGATCGVGRGRSNLNRVAAVAGACYALLCRSLAPKAPHRRELLHLGPLAGRSPLPDGLITCSMSLQPRSPVLGTGRPAHAWHLS